jgi:putative copper resistance protein D
MTIQAGLIACRFAHFSSLLALFGVAFYRFYAGGAGQPENAAADNRRRMAFVVLAIAAFASGLGWFAFTTASMAGALDRSAVETVLTQTDFGPLWAVRLVGVIAMLALVLTRFRGPSAVALLTLLAAGTLASLAGAGHARANQGLVGDLHVAADAVHLLAAGAWIGGLFALGPALRIEWRQARNGDPQGLEDTLRRFSGMGSWAVAALLATGVLNGWLLLGSIAALWTTAYGVLLTIKIALFFAMVGLAAANRFWITPRLNGPNPGAARGLLAALRRHVLAEQLLGLLVVAIVSVLGTLETPV